jgi:haloalkane dehalogenase
MNFITPTAEELSYLRPDPLVWEQELDVRPDVAEAIERAAGIRRGMVYWRSLHDYLYGLELFDAGKHRPSMARVYGHWDRYEPRPPEHEIDADLMEFLLWVADVSGSINCADVAKVAQFAGVKTSWAPGSVLRTPDDRFSDLPDFDYQPRYAEVEGLRMAYVEKGEGDPILMLHGEPTWGFLYRRMIEPLSSAGRVIVPDLIGFGRSDKPVATNAYSYRSHVRWVRRFIESMDMKNITLVCQDWGGLLGLRVLAQIPERFSRLVATNTGMPDGRGATEAFKRWRSFSQRVEMLDVAVLMNNTLKRKLTEEEARAYSAPFPSKEYQTAALMFPRLVPIRVDDPGAYDNRVAIEKLRTLELPVLLPWADGDPITAPAEKFLRSIFRNTAPMVTIKNAGHFIQEDAGGELANEILKWMAVANV